MKRKLLLTVVLFSFTCLRLAAQNYGNEWIDYSQSYFKLKVATEGIYRINRTQLISSGVPQTLVNLDIRRIQIFHNGIEQYIYVKDTLNNNILDASDFIEFYGEKNDGSLDMQLYADTNWQPNRRYSLFNDTAVYFLTWNDTANGLRLTEICCDTTNFPNYPDAPYFIREVYFQNTQSYNIGEYDYFGSSDVEYTEGEGWVDDRLEFDPANPTLPGNTRVKTVPTQNIYSLPGAPIASFSTVVCGRNTHPKHLTINVDNSISSSLLFDDTALYLFTKRTYNTSFALNKLGTPTTDFRYAITSFPSDPRVISASFSYLNLRYPHTFNFLNENVSSYKMFLPDATTLNKSRLEIKNFNFNGTHIFYDLTNHKRLGGIQNGNQLSIFVPNSGGEKICYLSCEGVVLTPSISPVFTMFSGTQTTQFTQFGSSVIAQDSAYLIITHPSLWSAANNYQLYRSSALGGNRNTIQIDIEELYDQFAYGVRKHPLAIKNFTRFLVDTWTSAPLNKIAPAYLFLIGKGYSAESSRYNATNYNNTLVPAMGSPGSDILFSSGQGFQNSLYDPVIATGRLAARNTTHVTDYLDKVRDYEMKQALVPVESWMKEVLHFGGGDSQSQQNQIKIYLTDSLEAVVEGCKYGGNVTSYYKTSTDPIQINQSDSLRTRINNGVSLITFFGHAAASGFDISTDHPSTYNNFQKYPLVIANSCYAGDVFTANSVSEDFVLQQDKGAIGFIASVHLGVEAFLARYSRNLYIAFSDSLYGKSIGQCMQWTVKKTQAPSPGEKRVCLEMTLHGDPAIRMNAWPNAELEIKQPDIYFTPAEVSTLTDSFKVNVIVHNKAQGVCPSDSFFVNIRRVYPDGADTVFVIKQFGCLYSDTVSINIPIAGSVRAAGLNQFHVLVDSLSRNDVPELYDEVNNNTASATLLIKSAEIYPVYPYKYAIVPYNSITLKASTADPFAPMKNYVFEIDTSDSYNSTDPAYHMIDTVTSVGGVVSWPNNLPLLRDSTVYYWRVALDSALVDTNYKWNESSFIHIPAKTGWSQAHYFQFKNDKYENVVYDRPNREFDYVIDNRAVFCNTFGNPGATVDINGCYFSINSSTIDFGTCNDLNPRIHIVVIDSLSLQPWNTDTCAHPYFGQLNYYSNIACNLNPSYSTCLGRTTPDHYFIFKLGIPQQMDSMVSMLRNKIPNGNYILAYTTGLSYTAPFYSQLDTSVFNAFNEIGFTGFTTIQDSVPFIFFTKKGTPSTAQSVIGSDYVTPIQLNALLTANWDRGNITSEIIGPALKWTSLHWKQHPVENPPYYDGIYINVYGIDNNGNDSLLLQHLTTPNYDTTLNTISLGFIPETLFPYLKLEAVTKDSVQRTPPQLTRWQVYYDEAPEAAINPGRFFEFHANSLSEGDSLTMRVAVENISQVPMDSIAMDFYLYDANRNRVNLNSYKADSLRVGQYIIADLTYPSTLGLSGSNNLWVEANPFNQWHQPEQYHFNNYAQLNVNVNKDVVNPILDVTFDGVHIIDGDIVSARPHILVRLHDENKFLALNDTSSFTFFLKTPSQPSAPIYFVDGTTFNDVLRFTPAVLPKNSCRIEWDPVFTQDGKYELIVQGRDRSLNYSGIFQYKITFEVINRSTITNVMNYPNPFSTSTRFVFTLTGSKIPDGFKIQIMTVSGKVVREIMREELGNIHVGRNITDYAWDGKDEFGDQLANGLYLYRVITKINGEDIEKRETTADNYFTNGFGKMYLMR